MIKTKGLLTSEIILGKMIENNCDVEATLGFVKAVFLLVLVSWFLSMVLSVVFLFVFPLMWAFVASFLVFALASRAAFRIMRHVYQSADYLAIMFLMFFHFARNDETFTFRAFVESLPDFYKYSMKDVGSFYSKYRKEITENE